MPNEHPKVNHQNIQRLQYLIVQLQSFVICCRLGQELSFQGIGCNEVPGVVYLVDCDIRCPSHAKRRMALRPKLGGGTPPNATWERIHLTRDQSTQPWKPSVLIL